MPDPDPVSPGRGLLAFGAPDYDISFDELTARTALTQLASTQPDSTQLLASAASLVQVETQPCSAFEAVRFGPLPASAREVADIAALWPREELGPTEIITGGDANEAAFKKLAPGHRVLHLATHGFFLDELCGPTTSGTTRGVGGMKATGDIASRPRGAVNPLLRAGLALAGANRRLAADPGTEDGLLSGQEIAVLDLGGVE